MSHELPCGTGNSQGKHNYLLVRGAGRHLCTVLSCCSCHERLDTVGSPPLQGDPPWASRQPVRRVLLSCTSSWGCAGVSRPADTKSQGQALGTGPGTSNTPWNSGIAVICFTSCPQKPNPKAPPSCPPLLSLQSVQFWGWGGRCQWENRERGSDGLAGADRRTLGTSSNHCSPELLPRAPPKELPKTSSNCCLLPLFTCIGTGFP